mgnify:FL=1
MYPGLSHDEIIEECLKELKHHFEVGPEVALISAKKVFSVCRLMNPFKRSFLTLRGLTKSLTFRIRIFRFATSQSRFSPQAEEKS